MLVFFVFLGVVTYDDTEIYQPLLKEHCVITESRVFLCHHANDAILVYDLLGNKIQSIGQKGIGPGEFQSLDRVFLRGEKLFAMEYRKEHKAQIFDLKGNFERGVRMPPGASAIPARDGWISIDAEGLNLQYLVLWNEDFSQRKTLQKNKFPTRKLMPGTLPVYLPRSYLRVLPGGQVAFYYQPESASMAIYSGDGFRKMKQVPLTHYDLEVPNDWMVEKRRQFLQRLPSRLRQKAIQFPEVFPEVKWMELGPGPHLVVYQAPCYVQADFQPLVLNAKGEKVTLGLSAQALKRTVEIQGDEAYLITVFQNEEAGLVRLPVGEIEAYIAAHPLPEDWDL